MNPDKPLGVILTGGAGARLGGRDKGLMEFNGRNLIEYVIAAIGPQVSNIVISANRNFTEYQNFTNHVVADVFSRYSGPLAGIFSVMAYLEAPKPSAAADLLGDAADLLGAAADLLIVPCDMPLLPADLSARLCKTRNYTNKQRPVIANDGDRLQPLCCLLPLTLKQNLKDYLEAGNRKAGKWFQTMDALVADFSDEKSKFVNINSRDDLYALARTLKADG